MFSFIQTLRLSVLSVFALTLLLGISAPLQAEEAEFKTITTERLKELLDEKGDFTLVDARTKEEYEEAHIGSAVNIQEKNFDELAALLPADKNALLVFYCNGVKCGKSKKVAAKAKGAGYTNILVYLDGFPVWEERGMPIITGPAYEKKIESAKLSPADIQKIISGQDQGYVIVDVRSEVEFAEGHIPTAINIPVETFATKSGVLPKDKKIVVYCNSGARSFMAYRKLIRLAYPTIYQAIFDDWKKMNLPVMKSELKCAECTS
jgi:rhodanese-related sulfurtransferase